MIRRRLIISGRVQNVFYRDWLVKQAQARGVDGWVRNRADGRVEVIVQGAPEMVASLIALARQGSPAARVNDVEISEETGSEPLAGFIKRPTM